MKPIITLVTTLLAVLSATLSAFAAVPLNYVSAYDSALQGSWVRSCWESDSAPVFTNFAAAAPQRTGKAIEVRFGAANAWNAFGLADRKPGWDQQWKYLNEFKTIEFELYIEPDATGMDNVTFILEDSGLADEINLVDLIPGWAGMSAAQRTGHWFHITVNLPQIHPVEARFAQFLLFNGSSDGRPHFRVADVKLGWVNDTTPPVITPGAAALNLTYDQLALSFTTDEATLYRVEYGTSDYSQVVRSGDDDWSTSHSATLTGLTPGATVQYRIVALDHRTDPKAVPNQAVYASTFAIPAIPTAQPVISDLAVTGITGNRADIAWSTDRPCAAVVTYHKNGSPDFSRSLADFVSQRAFVLDLLEPSASYTVTVSATDAFHLTTTGSTTFDTSANGASTITIAVDAAHTHPISKWIYGSNSVETMPNPARNLTLSRLGGNRWTAYNWENNASNAGSDYGPYESDGWIIEALQYYSNPAMPVTLNGLDTPGEAVRTCIAADRTAGMATLMTVPLQGYVAADKTGNVNINDPSHLAKRFKKAIPSKGAPFTATPSVTDGNVYTDEFLWALRNKFPGDIFADANTPTFVSLDNEPDLWFSTHAEIQPTAPTPESFIQRTIALTKAIKAVAPAAQTFGPVNYGFYGMTTWQGAQGFTSDYWFVDQYLDEMKAASAKAGKRLLDVYDFHWYSEARLASDTTGKSLSDEQVQAIVQSPRSLWDTSYTEDSWIAEYIGGPIFILGRMQAKIDARWPGTKLAITEYENGGNNHIAGAIAQADNLGIFGQQGLFAATFWPTSETYDFAMAGFRMYRDYDGNQGSFGDICLPATSSDTSKVAAYVSRDSSRDDRCVMVALNRSTTPQDVSFSGLDGAGIAKVYRVQGANPVPVFVGEVPVNLSSWIVTLPPLSVSTIEVTLGGSISTAAATNISRTGAKLNAALNGDAVDGTISFEWGLSPNALTNKLNATASTSAELTSLSRVTTYYYRAVCTVGTSTQHGATLSFTTLNQPAVANPDTVSALPSAKTVIDVLANDTDADGDALSITAFTQPEVSVGTVAKVGNALVFIAGAQFSGGSFDYTISDGFGSSSTATVTLAPAACSLDSTNGDIAAAGGVLELAITTDASWAVVESLSWVSASSASGTGSGPVILTVQPNSSKTGRVGNVTIGGVSYTVTQSGVQPPTLSVPASIPVGVVSSDYTLAIPVVNGPVSYTVTGLPPGLAINRATGLISGKPNAKGSFKVTVKASNAAGSAPAIAFVIPINELPAVNLGSFSALVERQPAKNLGDNLGGVLALNITSTGNFTGTLKLGASSYAFSNRLDVPLTGNATATFAVTAAGKPPLAVSFTIAGTKPGSLDGTCADPSSPGTKAAFHGWRQLTVAAPVSLIAASKAPANDPSVPAGDGTFALKVTSTGAATWSGKLADGTALGGSTALWINNEVPVWQALYTNKGSVQGRAIISPGATGAPPALGGTINWFKQPHATTKDINGFGPADLTLSAPGK